MNSNRNAKIKWRENIARSAFFLHIHTRYFVFTNVLSFDTSIPFTQITPCNSVYLPPK